MARGINESYADALADVHAAIARAKLAPDADLEFLNGVEGQIIERMQNPAQAPVGVSAAGAQPGFSASQLAGQGQGVPTRATPGRLPPPGIDAGPATADFAEALNAPA